MNDSELDQFADLMDRISSGGIFTQDLSNHLLLRVIQLVAKRKSVIIDYESDQRDGNYYRITTRSR